MVLPSGSRFRFSWPQSPTTSASRPAKAPGMKRSTNFRPPRVLSGRLHRFHFGATPTILRALPSPDTRSSASSITRKSAVGSPSMVEGSRDQAVRQVVGFGAGLFGCPRLWGQGSLLSLKTSIYGQELVQSEGPDTPRRDDTDRQNR